MLESQLSCLLLELGHGESLVITRAEEWTISTTWFIVKDKYLSLVIGKAINALYEGGPCWDKK